MSVSLALSGVSYWWGFRLYDYYKPQTQICRQKFNKQIDSQKFFFQLLKLYTDFCKVC